MIERSKEMIGGEKREQISFWIYNERKEWSKTQANKKRRSLPKVKRNHRGKSAPPLLSNSLLSSGALKDKTNAHWVDKEWNQRILYEVLCAAYAVFPSVQERANEWAQWTVKGRSHSANMKAVVEWSTKWLCSKSAQWIVMASQHDFKFQKLSQCPSG